VEPTNGGERVEHAWPDGPQHGVSILRFGTRQATRSAVFHGYQLYGEADGAATIDYHFWLLHAPDGGVAVVDTGFSRKSGRARGRTMLIEPGELLVRMGIDPLAVGLVVLTHAHYDHTGNVDLFPNARIVLSRAEYDFWLHAEVARRTQFAYYAEPSDLEALARALRSGRLELFDDQVVPVPGVVVRCFPGHTPGQAAVLVMTDEGPVVLASDVVHFYEELLRDRPFAVTTDLAAMYASTERLRRIIADAGAHLVTGHDPSTLDRFQRAPGPLSPYVASIGLSSRPGATGAHHMEDSV